MKKPRKRQEEQDLCKKRSENYVSQEFCHIGTRPYIWKDLYIICTKSETQPLELKQNFETLDSCFLNHAGSLVFQTETLR